MKSKTGKKAGQDIESSLDLILDDYFDNRIPHHDQTYYQYKIGLRQEFMSLLHEIGLPKDEEEIV